MAWLFEANTFGEVWDDLISSILSYGIESSPRDKPTKELTNVTIDVVEGLNNILVSPYRDLNFRFMIAEWLWIQAGINDLEILAKYNSAMRQFSDDGQILSGAYGPRLMPQIPYVLEALSKPESRQAVATIWTPSPKVSVDIPCTVSLQWLIRKNKLNCTINMRSSDAWLGLPYDYFTFSQITNYISCITGYSVGSITMNLASSHLYDHHFDLAGKISGSQTIKSPQIPKDFPIPNSYQLESFLRQEGIDYYPFWMNYAYALTKNKSQALEILYAIQPPK